MCKHLEEIELYEYLDQALDQENRVRVSNHLSLCGDCRQKLAEIKLMFFELDHLEAIEIPDALDDLREDLVMEAFADEEVSRMKALGQTIQVQTRKVRNSAITKQVVHQKSKATKLGKYLWQRRKNKKAKVKDVKKPPRKYRLRRTT